MYVGRGQHGGVNNDELRTVGVLGGMSPASTTVYYDRLVAGVNDALGGHAAPPVTIHSVNFADVEPMIEADRWEAAGAYLADSARLVEQGGAEVLFMATNTMHRVADAIETAVDVPFVHIVDPVADAARDRSLDTLGVLGTQATMSGAFYHDRFAAHGIDTLVPDSETQSVIDRIIFEELVHNETREASREQYLSAIESLVERGAEGIVFGCTEIELLVAAADVSVPVFDTTALHVERAVEMSLGERPLPE